MSLYSADDQMGGRSPKAITIGEAVAQGLVANQTIGYFMARIQLFLAKVGVDSTRLRFRQHMGNEMAHYACDCWDAELLTSYGWVECVGCADRSAYDLTQHSTATGVRLCAEKKLPAPVTKDVTELTPNKVSQSLPFTAFSPPVHPNLQPTPGPPRQGIQEGGQGGDRSAGCPVPGGDHQGGRGAGRRQ